MPFIKQIQLRNFRCFRRQTDVTFDQATYLIGINNSGKTALLSAINCFFDESSYQPGFLNRTEFVAKKEGYNRSDITITFNITLIAGVTRKKRMLNSYGQDLKIRRSFTYREVSGIVVNDYFINDTSYPFDNLDSDIQDILNAVSISYIHPQEGENLLLQAQEKFKARLFHNWGRHASVAGKLRDLQKKWDELKKTANTYLSASLTSNIQKIWPNSSTKVDLPDRIQDIVAISDITFRSSPNLPEVTLTDQGTGAQSTILYQTHYLLDSDRSLHQGFYSPIWLLEEPESFLHADIAVKLGTLLNSDEWLTSIQMIISTHSPLILACSRQNSSQTSWVVFRNHVVEMEKPVEDVTSKDIEEVGQLMGDPNFDAYFAASQKGPLLFIEDSRKLTRQKYEEAGIYVTEALDGVSTIKKYITVFMALDGLIRKRAIFLLDNDKGTKELSSYLTTRNKKKEENGFSLYSPSESTHLLLLPQDFSAEDLFEEFDNVLEDCVHEIYDVGYILKKNVPTNLTRVVAMARKKDPPANLDAAKLLIKNEQDVKDIFWQRVEEGDYKICVKYSTILKGILSEEKITE